MTYSELVALDKALTSAGKLILELRVDSTDYAYHRLSNAWQYIREQSIEVGKQLNAYFEVSA